MLHKSGHSVTGSRFRICFLSGNKLVEPRAVVLILVGAVLLGVATLSIGYSAPSGPAITAGTESEARAYYSKISSKLGFNAVPEVTTLDSLLAFLGYSLTGASLEAFDSATLMSQFKAASSLAASTPGR